MKTLILKSLAILYLLILITSCSANYEEVIVPEENIEEPSGRSLDSTKKHGQSSDETAGITAKEKEILDLINDYRVSKGLPKLQVLKVIKSQTLEHTNYMIETLRISHDNFHKRREFLKREAKAITVGENVAYGFEEPEKLVDAWIKSDGHRETIEGNYNYFNITAKACAENKWYYTNIFIRK